jgi:hypothetical protein
VGRRELVLVLAEDKVRAGATCKVLCRGERKALAVGCVALVSEFAAVLAPRFAIGALAAPSCLISSFSLRTNLMIRDMRAAIDALLNMILVILLRSPP